MREDMMKTRLWVSGVVIVLSAGVSAQTATACSKEAVAGAVIHPAQAIATLRVLAPPWCSVPSASTGTSTGLELIPNQ
jgi:hypothetical protein